MREKAGSAIDHGFDDSSFRYGEDGRATRHRLDRHQSERFFIRRVKDQPRLAVQSRKLGLADPRAYAQFDATVTGSPFQP